MYLIKKLQYIEQVVAALKLATDGCADLILGLFLLFLYFLLKLCRISSKNSSGWPQLVDRTVHTINWIALYNVTQSVV